MINKKINESDDGQQQPVDAESIRFDDAKSDNILATTREEGRLLLNNAICRLKASLDEDIVKEMLMEA